VTPDDRVPRSIRLRPWQRAALERFSETPGRDFLAVATPGAGKTTFALAAARQLLAADPSRLVVVVPTAHLKFQWARAAAALDLHLDPGWSSRVPLAPDMHGIVTTYQQVATAPRAIARLAESGVVILDEIHHAGDERAWGESLLIAFENARRRLALSGTPFRSDTRSIPFVRYEMDEARPDFEYGYGPALAEHRVVRPVYFPRTNGQMEWSAPDGTLHAASFDDALDVVRANQRLRAALSLEGEWLGEVLSTAHERLMAIRQTHRDAGGLVIATDQEHARGIATLMTSNLGTRVVVATSDDPFASQRILAYASSNEPWLVAVRMVSEGVDIPRLRVGVFATTTTTELFFRQAVGRLVRWQHDVGRQSAYLFIPDDARLRNSATQIADDRRHSLRRSESPDGAPTPDDQTLAATADDPVAAQLSLFSVISAVATDAILPDDEAPDEPITFEEDPSLTLQLPPAPSLPKSSETGSSGPVSEAPLITRTEVKARLRLANAALAQALVRRTGWSHAKVNAELNRLVGLRRVAEATTTQLENRIRRGEAWFASL
jgi:superfamily II DNA or RNA helicase